ncbi:MULTISPECIES: hypothetical protein [Pseudomonadota]|jgi:hypothetical protein|uniref:hypothetical protein n=1 Tax=Pseudomonadota TaxID=1224 RepID=UPI000A40B0AE|nr:MULTISPECIES: hypothetical protein [Pseudomonadota]
MEDHIAWAVGSKNDAGSNFIFGGDRFERIITQDHHVLTLSSHEQFPSSGNAMIEGSVDFLRASYEFGRCFYRIRRNRKSLPARAREYWYCDRFKTALEQAEPNKHRFAPIDLRLEDGVTPWPERYWYWSCDNFINAIVPDIGDDDPRRSKDFFWDTDNGWLAEKNGWIPTSARPLLRNMPVLSASAIKDFAAFHEAGFRMPNRNYLFLSDDFVDTLRRSNAVVGLELSYVTESELPAARPSTDHSRSI